MSVGEVFVRTGGGGAPRCRFLGAVLKGFFRNGRIRFVYVSNVKGLFGRTGLYRVSLTGSDNSRIVVLTSTSAATGK